jgi:biopolymer transport protein ExbD
MILIAPLIDKSELKIKPPETLYAKKDEATKGINIDIDKEGQLAINSHYVAGSDSEKVAATIKQLVDASPNKEEMHVTLNADGDAKQKYVVEVMSAVAAAGVKKMRVATRQQNN